MLSVWRPTVEADANLRHGLWLLLLGLSVGIAGMILPEKVVDGKGTLHSPKWFWSILMLVGLGGVAVSLPELWRLFEKYPPTTAHSDIIPQIEVMASRFMQGEFPYAVILDFGYPIHSPYMPFHWGPFMLSVKAAFEPRYIVLGIWTIAVLVYVWSVWKRVEPWIWQLGLSLLPGIFLYWLVHYHFVVFSHTVELMIAGYYLILGVCLLSRNPWVIGTGLLLCLLSRYAVVLWVPMFLLAYLWQMGWRKILYLGGMLLGGMLMLYVIPFLSQDWNLPLAGLEHHAGVTLTNWTHEPWFGPNGKPGALYRGAGLAGYFYEWWPGETKTQIQAVERAQLLLSGLLLLGLGILYWYKRKSLKLERFALGSLKIYLTVFFSLLALPIDYYFILPAVVSWPMLVSLLPSQR